MPKARGGHVLATVLFTDIVDSTAIAKELGDRRWRVLLDRHHTTVRKAIKQHHGREIDNSGDGFFANFTDQVEALRCACQISDDVTQLGIEVRAGCHVGQAEIVGRKLGGVTVHGGARVMSAAGPSEVLVSNTVKELVPASGFTFADRGTHHLKGLEGEWHLYAVTGVDGEVRSPRLAPEEMARRREEIKPPPVVERRSGRIGIAALSAILVAGVIIFITQRPRPIRIEPNSLIQIDPSTKKVVADVPVAEPDAAQLAFVSPTDEIWVLSQRDQVVTIVDATTHTSEPLPLFVGHAEPAGNGYGIAYAFGGVWVTGGDNALEEFDPRTKIVGPKRRSRAPPRFLRKDPISSG
jgi:class 3 adenylate cyclase